MNILYISLLLTTLNLYTIWKTIYTTTKIKLQLSFISLIMLAYVIKDCEVNPIFIINVLFSITSSMVILKIIYTIVGMTIHSYKTYHAVEYYISPSHF